MSRSDGTQTRILPIEFGPIPAMFWIEGSTFASGELCGKQNPEGGSESLTLKPTPIAELRRKTP